jgi:hypothetical protein
MCPSCGTEYDARMNACPGCAIPIEMRDAKPPFKTWTATGHLPFEMFGEKFAVTELPGLGILRDKPWRATHVETGAGLPGTECNTMREVPEHTKKKLAEVGEEKFRAALQRIKQRIATGKEATLSAIVQKAKEDTP